MLSGDILADLRHRYGEPHRRVHTWVRVGDMLEAAEDVVNGIAERHPFILAILFHRAVFQPRSSDSPARSVALMRSCLAATAPAWVLDRAEALILALADREVPDTDDPSLRGDAALLLDFDHAVLGSVPSRFAEYEAALRDESPHLSTDRYRIARAASLQMLLWKDRIFLTDRFYLAREKQARQNIEGAIVRLEAA